MKKIVFLLLILLQFCPLALAGSIYVRTWHEEKGEFASPEGVFNSNLGMPSTGELATKGLFSNQAVLKSNSGVFSSPSGVFSSPRGEFNSTNSDFKNAGSGFGTQGLFSSTRAIMTEEEDFKSPNDGDFKFTLPK